MEIVFENVSVVRNKGTMYQKTVLENFNTTFKDNKITGLCGKVGKSTIGKLIPALDGINNGTIKLGNFELSKNKMVKDIKALRKKVGYVPSNFEDFLFKRNVLDELEYALKHYDYAETTINKRVREAVRLVGLNEAVLKTTVRNLSFSQAKRVMLASILIFNPEVIILDDFEKGFSKKEKTEMKILLKNLKNKYNKTIVVITNDVEFLMNLCDEVKCLDAGRIILEGSKKIFYDNDLYKYVSKTEIVKFVQAANEKNAKLEEYTDIKELMKAVYRNVK